MNTIDFNQIQDAEDLIKKTGKTPQECKKIIKEELEKLRGNT